MKNIFFSLALAFGMAVVAPVMISSHSSIGYHQASAAEVPGGGMKRLTLIMKKLRDAMGSMKDFDELEKAGLAKKDVDRMRRAMKDKINQMMEDAIYAIRAI